jgi:hypothetical protein
VTALNLSNKAVQIGSYTLKKLAFAINSSFYPLEACPSSAPLYNGSHCIACNKSYYYDLRSLKCINAQLVSNVNALNATNKTIAFGIYNLSALVSQISALVVPYKPCPASKPLFNGTICKVCPPSEYYNLETLKCYKPLYASNITALNASARLLQVNNWTLINLQAAIAAQPFPTKPCPQATPFLSHGACIACNSPLYYDL